MYALIVFSVVLVIENAVGLLSDQTPAIGSKGTKCYDDYNRPQVNAIIFFI